MFLDIFLHSPVQPLNIMVFESRALNQIQIAATFHPGGHPLWVTYCEEMFPAAHEFIIDSQTPPPGAAEIPALVDILKPVCAIYPVDLPAACQGTSYDSEDG